MEKFCVLLDNGHGKETQGKRSPLWEDGTQLFEYRYTRDIVNGICDIFTLAYPFPDIVLIKLTPEETDVPLSERCRRANNCADVYGTYNCLGISIHVNAFNGNPESKANGWELHTYFGESLSDRYSEIFWATFDSFQKEMKMRQYSPDNKDFENNFAILRDTRSPFIITENGFMDNREECRFLLSDAGRKTVIDGHIYSILRCYNYWKQCKILEGFNKGLINTTNFQKAPIKYEAIDSNTTL